MKKIFGFVVLLGLLGCGPEQTSRDKALEQTRKQEQEIGQERLPYFGTYVGKATVNNQSWDVEVVLTPSDQQQPNQSTLQATPAPLLQGSLNICYEAHCFDPDVDNLTGSNEIHFSSGQPDSNQTLLIYVARGTCTPLNSSNADCSEYTITLNLTNNNNTLVGPFSPGHNKGGTLTLNRVK